MNGTALWNGLILSGMFWLMAAVVVLAFVLPGHTLVQVAAAAAVMLVCAPLFLVPAVPSPSFPVED